MEDFAFIDVMAGSPPQLSRWDRGDHDAAIHALDGALSRAGLPGELAPALRVLERAEQLVAASRVEREKAQAKLDAASRGLLTDVGDVDVAAYGDVLRECAPWISDDAAAAVGVGDAARQVRMRATMTVFGMASGIYSKLRDHCRDVVTVIGGIPDPPADVWRVQSFADASTAMIRHNREADWAKLVRLHETWTNIQDAAKLLRETGQFEVEMHFDGAPTELGLLYLNWQGAVGPEQLAQLPAPLKVRRAHDLGWLPGCWLASDHRKYAAEQVKPKRRMFAALTSGRSGNPPTVADEFSAG